MCRVIWRVAPTLRREGLKVPAWAALANACISITVLLLPGAGAAAGWVDAAAAGPAEVAAVAERAKDIFRRRMTPPAPYLTLLQVVEREESQAARAYALRAFGEALDALTAEARRAPERAGAIEAALRKFVAAGKASAADPIFARLIEDGAADGPAGRRRQAAAIRHGVALVELPAALAPLIKLPGEALPLPPLGEKALPAYRRAAALDPDEPWTWIAIAWMEQARGGSVIEAGTAVDLAERAALASGDRDATIVALQTRASLSTAEGRLDDAARALRDAVRLSEGQTGAGAAADLALRLSLLGETERRRGDAAQAASAFARAFELRRTLAVAAPDDGTAQLDLAASYIHLAMLAAQQDRSDVARAHWQDGFAVYDAVASRDRFLPTLDVAQPGAVSTVFMLAGVLTLVGGIVLLVLYRRTVDRLMKAASAAGGATAPGAGAPTGGAGAPTELAIRTLSASRSRRTLAQIHAARPVASGSPAIAGAERGLQHAAVVQVLAGAAFAAVATLLMFTYTSLDYSPLRAALTFWTWVWPVVIVLGLLWGRDRARMALVLAVYLGGLLLICAVVAAGDTPPHALFGVLVPAFFQPLLFWALGIFYSLFLLFFLIRQVRSVGPVLLVFTLIASSGGLLAMLVMSMYAAARALASVSAGLGLSAEFVILLIPLLGMIGLALPAWWVIARIGRAYQEKRISDLTLMFGGIWLFQALVLCQELILEVGLPGWIGLTAFAAYKLVAFVGVRPLAAAAARRPAARLLLLRVFGFRGRTERLFDVLAARWRFAGPIQMIAAPDLAARTIDPGEFIDFLSGRLRRRFITEPGDLQRRLAEIDVRPDADGRFRVNDIFCGNDTWQAAVESLMAESDLVAMDLRGFSPQNQGCVYELQALLNSVPAGRIVVFADDTTDRPFLDRTLADCARAMAPASPNRSSPDPLTVLEIRDNERSAVRALLAIADAALANPRDLARSGSLASN